MHDMIDLQLILNTLCSSLTSGAPCLWVLSVRSSRNALVRLHPVSPVELDPVVLVVSDLPGGPENMGKILCPKLLVTRMSCYNCRARGCLFHAMMVQFQYHCVSKSHFYKHESCNSQKPLPLIDAARHDVFESC